MVPTPNYNPRPNFQSLATSNLLRQRLQSSLISLMALSLILLASRVTTAAPQTPDDTGIESTVVVSELKSPTDFSVVNGGEIIFVAELANKQIRRFRGSNDEVVVDRIGNEAEVPQGISVFAIDGQTVLVGVKGSFEPIYALSVYEFPQEEALPLDYYADAKPNPRNVERVLKDGKSFNVQGFLANPRSVSVIYETAKEPLRLADVKLKQKAIMALKVGTISERLNLATLAIDSLGGYFVAISDDGNAVVFATGDGVFMESFPIKLPHVKSLAFAPQSHRLFALVAPPKNNKQSVEESENANPAKTLTTAGVYEIVAGGDSCQTRLAIEVDYPKLMKFDGQGNAWILCGTDDEQKGLLKKISGLDTLPPQKTQPETKSDAN